MRLLEINSVCGIRSTGRIAVEIAKEYEAEGYEVKIAYGREKVPEQYQKYAIRIGSEIDVRIHGIKSRILDRHGFFSKRATKKFLKWADQYDPDILWLHNIHGYYINIELLFQWIKSRTEMKVRWTLHDCWAFTGHCAYFTMANCNKWMKHCKSCPQKKRYPMSYIIDSSDKNFDRKKALFTGVKDMVLISPSQWLASLVKESYLKEYPVEVHYNTIDKTIFRPIASEFRKKYQLEHKRVILGVASFWDERKGLEDFYKLAEMLDDKYAIVLVGLSMKQIMEIPKKVKGVERKNNKKELVAIYSPVESSQNMSGKEICKATSERIITHKDLRSVHVEGAHEGMVDEKLFGVAVKPSVGSIYQAITGHIYSEIIDRSINCCMLIAIPHTKDTNELVEIYSSADYFVNPTYEDNYPTVNLEAKACGTYVITYDIGGSKETLLREN